MTTDSVVFGFDGRELHVLLIERGLEPCKGMWALPGGFMNIDETVEQCAMRELFEETGVRITFLEQFHVFSSVNRDPRERVITVAFLALVRKSDYQLIAGDDAARANWFEINMLPPLAFDHQDIIKMARERLREVLATRPIAFRLLDKEFSMSELQRVYEAINGVTYDRRNFAKKMNSTGLLRCTDDDSDPDTNGSEPIHSNIECRCVLFDATQPDACETDKPQQSKRSKFYSFDEEAFEKLKENPSKKTNPFNL